jgi:N-acetylneuraminate synthase
MSNIYIIAEIGINHNGDLDLAKQLIAIAKDSGCDAVKFQKRTIEDVYTEEELDAPRESPWGSTNREQKEGLEFSIEEYKELQQSTEDAGLDFIISCWDQRSVDLVEKHLDVKYHKVASAMATNKDFLQRLNKTNKPVILSTGMCSQKQVDAAVGILDNIEYVLACTSTYPTKYGEVNLAYIATLREKFDGLKIGFSNHYNGHLGCIGAAFFGAECVEFHITIDRTMYGSDQAASIECVKELVDGVRKAEVMIGDGVKVIYDDEVPIVKKLRKVDDILS